MKSFLDSNRPILTTMLKGENKKELLEEISSAVKAGTDAFGLQIELMPTKERTAADFKDLFAAMEGRLIYITNYRRLNVSEKEQTDEELTEEMFLAMDCGATLFDVRGDLFDPRPDEFTVDEKAVERQMEVIKTVHAMGKEVLMSTHTLEYTSPERVLEIMKAHEARGADICKLVAAANTEEEEFQAFENLFRLSRELKVPYLYLINGDKCLRHRHLSPLLGNQLFLVTADEVNGGSSQPRISSVKNTIKGMYI